MRKPVPRRANGYPTVEYVSWSRMRLRCLSPKAHNYKWYGGRGVSICDRWSDFEYFLADMGLKPSVKHTLDRIDNNGNYEPGNCRWSLPKVIAEGADAQLTQGSCFESRQRGSLSGRVG